MKNDEKVNTNLHPTNDENMKISSFSQQQMWRLILQGKKQAKQWITIQKLYSRLGTLEKNQNIHSYPQIMECLYKLGFNFRKLKQWELASKCLEDTYQLAGILNNLQMEIKVINILPEIHYELKKYSKALEEAEILKQIYIQMKKEPSKIAKVMTLIAKIHQKQGRLEECLKAYKQIDEMLMNECSKHTKQLAIIKRNISEIYFTLQNFQESINQSSQAIYYWMQLYETAKALQCQIWAAYVLYKAQKFMNCFDLLQETLKQGEWTEDFDITQSKTTASLWIEELVFRNNLPQQVYDKILNLIRRFWSQNQIPKAYNLLRIRTSRSLLLSQPSYEQVGSCFSSQTDI